MTNAAYYVIHYENFRKVMQQIKMETLRTIKHKVIKIYAFMVVLHALSYGRSPAISFHMFHVILMISICFLATKISFPNIIIISHLILPLTMA